jgi:cytochrome c oxidase cbb3-type subunit 3
MSELNTEDQLLDHNYDGIQEYDNPLPTWWVTMFWISIVFAVFYTVYYHYGHGKLAVEAYNEDMVAFYELQAKQLLALGEIKESTLLDLMDDDAMMATGASLFVSKCAQCHGNKGEGNIGPNLTDEYWLHGGKLTDIYHTVTEGVPSKGMLAWKNQLGPAEILSVSAFVGSLRGSNPSPAKEPQGDVFAYDVEAILAEEAASAEQAGEEATDETGGEATETEAETATSSE